MLSRSITRFSISSEPAALAMASWLNSTRNWSTNLNLGRGGKGEGRGGEGGEGRGGEGRGGGGEGREGKGRGGEEGEGRGGEGREGRARRAGRGGEGQGGIQGECYTTVLSRFSLVTQTGIVCSSNYSLYHKICDWTATQPTTPHTVSMCTGGGERLTLSCGRRWHNRQRVSGPLHAWSWHGTWAGRCPHNPGWRAGGGSS